MSGRRYKVPESVIYDYRDAVAWFHDAEVDRGGGTQDYWGVVHDFAAVDCPHAECVRSRALLDTLEAE